MWSQAVLAIVTISLIVSDKLVLFILGENLKTKENLSNLYYFCYF